jgi:hypothetical protein
LPGFAIYAEAKKTKGLPEPGIGHGRTRRKQSFDPLEPEAGVARPLIDLGPRHAVVPSNYFQHGTLHRAREQAMSTLRETASRPAHAAEILAFSRGDRHISVKTTHA